MNIIPIQYRWLIGIGLLMASFISGVVYEHGKLLEFKGEVKGAAQVQEQITKLADTKNQGDADESQKRIILAVQGIDAWYKSHPVTRVQHDGSCAMPKAISDTKGTDEISTRFYASPYSPRDTEEVAARLDELQKRLISGGVTIQ